MQWVYLQGSYVKLVLHLILGKIFFLHLKIYCLSSPNFLSGHVQLMSNVCVCYVNLCDHMLMSLWPFLQFSFNKWSVSGEFMIVVVCGYSAVCIYPESWMADKMLMCSLMTAQKHTIAEFACSMSSVACCHFKCVQTLKRSGCMCFSGFAWVLSHR